MRVGFDQYNYGAARNVYAPVAGITYKKVQRLPFDRIPGVSRPWLEYSFVPVMVRRISVLHTWNRVNWGPGRWGSTFESEFPRFFLPPDSFVMGAALRRIASPRCRFLIGMSKWSLDVFRSLWQDSVTDGLAQKLHQVYPASSGTARWRRRSLSPEDTLRLVFVGGDFFRKGGEAVLRAVEAVGESLDVRIVMVTRIGDSDVGARLVPGSRRADIRRRLSESERIVWHTSLSHADVMATLDAAHVAVLPTLNDTFGYSAVEGLELGVPVIASDISALPEFVDDAVGWPIPLPKDPWGYWEGWKLRPGSDARARAYEDATVSMTERMIAIFHDLRNDPGQLVGRSEGAKKRIQDLFSSDEREKTMRLIYESAVEGS